MSSPNRNAGWDRFKTYLCAPPGVDVRLDPSRMGFDDDYLVDMEPEMQRAFDSMAKLEAGEIANPDENRRVGHYWLRAPDLAPGRDDAELIRRTLDEIDSFASAVHRGSIRPPAAERFENLLLIGIGGSALGPQLVSDALVDGEVTSRRSLRSFFIDNTDPDGIHRCLQQIEKGTRNGLGATLTIVVSKSGGTPETRNGMLEARKVYEAADLSFPDHAVAITMQGSKLDDLASREKWLRRFPMWDWVGGRTSETSAVGLVPAALEGLDIWALLEGARRMDEATRVRETRKNPAALLALMWHHAGEGKGTKEMVIIPYKDRLVLLSKYLQQLVMESLGKERDLDGCIVHQGLTVYGNKGSTDQHAYIQQLRDGLPDFFVTFIQVLEDGHHSGVEVEPGVTSGDFLLGFQLGTRRALHEQGRGSVTLTVPRVDAEILGQLIALFERAVGLYAALIHINAYHQPGVEAGKKAAAAILALQAKVLDDLREHRGELRTAEDIAMSIGAVEETETIFHLLEHRASNPAGEDPVERHAGEIPYEARYAMR